VYTILTFIHDGPAIAAALRAATVNGVTVAGVVELSITLRLQSSSVPFAAASTISSKLS